MAQPQRSITHFLSASVPLLFASVPLAAPSKVGLAFTADENALLLRIVPLPDPSLKLSADELVSGVRLSTRKLPQQKWEANYVSYVAEMNRVHLISPEKEFYLRDCAALSKRYGKMLENNGFRKKT
jgi:hypothetical protein